MLLQICYMRKSCNQVMTIPKSPRLLLRGVADKPHFGRIDGEIDGILAPVMNLRPPSA
jgi:hypothetical protein